MMNIAVLLSGSGTTLKNLISRVEQGDVPVRIVQVISSKPNVRGIEIARTAGIPVDVVERRSFSNRDAFSDDQFQRCRDRGADLVCLAGYLQLITIPPDYHNRVVNIHPSLLPAFGGKGMYGIHVHQAVLEFGAKVSGCTVHFADNQFDHGPIILQRAVDVLPDDSAESLAARVFAAECQAYPDVIKALAEGRVRIDGRHVTIQPASTDSKIPR